MNHRELAALLLGENKKDALQWNRDQILYALFPTDSKQEYVIKVLVTVFGPENAQTILDTGYLDNLKKIYSEVISSKLVQYTDDQLLLFYAMFNAEMLDEFKASENEIVVALDETGRSVGNKLFYEHLEMAQVSIPELPPIDLGKKAN